jgi:hypothetical protein
VVLGFKLFGAGFLFGARPDGCFSGKLFCLGEFRKDRRGRIENIEAKLAKIFEWPKVAFQFVGKLVAMVASLFNQRIKQGLGDESADMPPFEFVISGKPT